MWQMPTWEHPQQKITPEQIVQHAKNNLGIQSSTPWQCLTKFKHQTTHITITFHLWLTQDPTGRVKALAGQWASLTKIKNLPFSNPQRKAVEIAVSEKIKNLVSI